MYKLELHCHNKEVSACSTCSAEELIKRYRAAGYNGIVSTNHLNGATFRGIQEKPWREKVAFFFHGIEVLKKAAGDDFDVLPGCEINLTPYNWPSYIPNDYLLFGITENWLNSVGDVRKMKIDELSQCVHEAGLLIIQAHPFRYGTVIVDQHLLDGYEVYNGSSHHDSNDKLANIWAQMNGKIMTSGSDFHYPDDMPSCGIKTIERIQDNDMLICVLRSGNYELLHKKTDASTVCKNQHSETNS